MESTGCRSSIHPFTHISLYGSTALGTVFLILYRAGGTPWTGHQPVATQAKNKSTQTSMPRVRFEPTIPVFEWAETVHALDCSATVIDHPPM
jgi:hypothetical protein